VSSSLITADRVPFKFLKRIHPGAGRLRSSESERYIYWPDQARVEGTVGGRSKDNLLCGFVGRPVASK
jgi:hypothetical protein